MNGHSIASDRKKHLSHPVKLSAHLLGGGRGKLSLRASRRLLWELLLFLLLSLLAVLLKNHNFHAYFGVGSRQLLGCPIPVTMLNLVLASYGFSTLVLIMTRRGAETRLVKRCFHFSFRTVFFLFYGFSGALAPNLLFVFSLGLCLYLCEQAFGWLVPQRIIAEEIDWIEEP